MFNKTTSYIFNRYGEIINDLSRRQTIKMQHQNFKLKNKSITNFNVYNDDVILKVTSGIVMLVVTLGS